MAAKGRRSIELRGKPLGNGELPAICTPLVGQDRNDILGELAAIVPKKPDLIEWRVDFCRDIADTAAMVVTARAIKAAAGGIPILFTRRSANEGGECVAITESAVLDLYDAMCNARAVDIVDYELSNPAEHFERVRGQSRQHAIAMIGSYHNFRSTPDAGVLLAKVREARHRGADIAKIAVMPNEPRDVLTLLGVTCEAGESIDIPLISMSMGPYGSVSRIVGGVFGSALTFAVGQKGSAPGQIPIEELRAVLATVRRATETG